MEMWEDQAIVLRARSHSENGAIVSILTQNHGRQSGYVHGATGRKMRGVLQNGNLVEARWQARNPDSLGTLSLELLDMPAAHIMDEPDRLAALQSACALCDTALPTGEGGSGVFSGTQALLDSLQTDVWGEVYVMWEVALLKELGFALDLSQCAGGGDSLSLAYISPKTGRAVSREKGSPYKDKLLPLPSFLGGVDNDNNEVLQGLTLTGYFLNHWVYVHHTGGVPPARTHLQNRVKKGSEG